MNSLLKIISTPPPIHGSNIMNQYVENSKILNEKFKTETIHYNFTQNVSEIGKIKFKKFFKFFKIIVKLIFKLIKFKPDLVYFPIVPYGFSFYRDLLIVAILKLFKRKIIFHLHGKGIRKNYSNNKLAYDFVFNNSAIICLSKILKPEVDFFNSKIYILNNGIYETKQNFKKKKSNILRILFLSNFIKEKGILDLLTSISLLVKAGNNEFVLNLVGNYTNEISDEILSNKIRSLNISEYVNNLGPLYENDKYEILTNSDLFIFPTYYPNECFPLSLIEACQYSLPIISTYEGAIPEIVENNFNGFLVNQNNVDELTCKIEELLHDKEKLHNFSKNSKTKFDKMFKIELFENKLKEIMIKEVEECVD